MAAYIYVIYIYIYIIYIYIYIYNIYIYNLYIYIRKQPQELSNGLTADMVCCNVLVDVWCRRYGRVPSEWKKSAIVPVLKRKRRGVCKVDDFRGKSVAYKQCVAWSIDGWCIMVEEKAVGGREARRYQERKRVQRPTNDIGIAGAVESSVRKGDVCQFHRL